MRNIEAIHLDHHRPPLGGVVYPIQAGDLGRRFAEIRKQRLVLDCRDDAERTLHSAVASGSKAPREAIGAALRNVLKVRGEVQSKPDESFAGDGRPIVDRWALGSQQTGAWRPRTT